MSESLQRQIDDIREELGIHLEKGQDIYKRRADIMLECIKTGWTIDEIVESFHSRPAYVQVLWDSVYPPALIEDPPSVVYPVFGI